MISYSWGLPTRAGRSSSGGEPEEGGEDADWIARSTAAGVVVANRLETQATITDWLVNDATAAHVSLDTSVKVDGALGSCKFAVLNGDDTGSGSISVPFGTSFGDGETFWWSFRMHVPDAQAYQPIPTTGDAETAVKTFICSRDANGTAPTNSNQNNEVVGTITYNANLHSGYHQDGVNSALPPDQGAVTDCSGSDFKWQFSIDNGASPLSGTNPDTGAAWSACEQDRAQFGGLYSAKSAANFRFGIGDPFSGGVRQKPGVWQTVTCRLQIGTMDGSSFNNRWTMWVADDGEAYRMVHDEQNMRLGNGPDYNGLTLLPYTTLRIAGGRKVNSRTSNITGAEIVCVGNGTATGDGVLEYNATTQRFRWHGNGETFGTARGFSAANDILLINVTSNSPTQSFVGIRVTPGSLPSSGTVTDTVNIASGRPDTQANYNDVIISTQPINAPGGFPPFGVSDLADAAAVMSSGDTDTFTMGNLTDAILTAVSSGGTPSIATFASRMLWDAAHRKIVFVGTAHTGGVVISGSGGQATWDDTTNLWSRETFAWNSEAPTHGYHHVTINPDTGDLYMRQFNSTNIWRRLYGGSWASGFSTIGGDYGNQVSGGLQWFPELNSGAAGLVFADVSGANWTASNLTSWSTQAGNSVSGNYDNWIAHAGGYVYFGGGNGSNTHYRLAPDGTVTSMGTTPIAGTNQNGALGAGVVYAHPNGTDLLMVEQVSSGRVWQFDGSAWTQITNHGVTGISSTTFLLAATVPDYGVMVFVQHPSGGAGTPNSWIYKP